MTAKKSAEVIIDGQVYTLSGYEEEGYLQQVGTYINNKINNIDEFSRLPIDKKHTLIELNIADDYFKAKETVAKYEAEVEQSEKEIYDLKHDLIANQINIEGLETRIRDLENKNQELELHKSKLEASLEDALLGGIQN